MTSNSSLALQKNIFRGAASSLFSLGITSIIGLIIMPMLVNHLGNRNYGVWVLVGTLTGYFAFLDLGLSKAVMRFVSQCLGRGDRDEANNWISLALTCFFILSLIGVLLSCLVLYISPRFLDSQTDKQVIPLALFVALLAFSLSLPARCFLGVLEAHVRKDLISLAHIFINVFRAATIYVLITNSGTLLFLVYAAAGFTLADALTLTLLARKVHGPFHFTKTAIKRERLKVFSEYALSSFVTQIMDIARNRSYPLIITPILGLAALTPFAIADRLIQLITSVCNGLLLSLTPAFSRFEGKGGLEGNVSLRNAYLFSYKISCYLGVFVVSMAFIFADAFITRWMGVSFSNVVPIFLLLLIGTLFAIIQIPTLCFLFAVSKHRFYAVTNSLHALLSILLCIGLIFPFKLLGVGIAIAASTAIIKAIVQPHAMLSFLRLSFTQYHFRLTLPNLLIPSVFFLAYAFLTKPFIQAEYLSIVTNSFIGIIAFILYVMFCGFNLRERKILLKILYPQSVG
jgi:O-antigen/teichoic acid export membrane protein